MEESKGFAFDWGSGVSPPSTFKICKISFKICKIFTCKSKSLASFDDFSYICIKITTN